MRIQISKWITIPVLCKVQDLILVKIFFLWFCEHAARVIDPGDCRGQHIQRVARQINNTGIREVFKQGFDLGAECRVLGNEIFLSGGIQVALQHGFVKGHDATLMLRRQCLIEVLVLRKFVQEREEKTHPEGVPKVQEDVLVLFRLKEGNAMDLDSPERAPVEFMQQTV
jgi:hypothetical protein